MASLEQCPHCKRKFVPKAFKHHQNACTAQNPAKPAGTGLIANSLSNCLVPGAIAGSKHGFASKDSKVLENLWASHVNIETVNSLIIQHG